MGGGGKRRWRRRLGGGGHTAWCTPSFPCHPPVTSSPYPCHSLPLPAPHACSSSLCALPAGFHLLKRGGGHLSRDNKLQSRLTCGDVTVLHYQGIKTRPPAQLAVFFGGFPLPPLLLIVKMRSLIAGWVKSPVISAGNHPLIERYHKSLPRAWFLLCLLGDPFVSWRSPPMGPQLTLLSVAEIRRVVLGDTHPHAWPKYRFKAVSSVRRNSWRMLWGVFVFCCTINAPDLIEEDAHIRHFPICKRGQVHSRG